MAQGRRAEEAVEGDGDDQVSGSVKSCIHTVFQIRLKWNTYYTVLPELHLEYMEYVFTM